jgi:hypothetical protein
VKLRWLLLPAVSILSYQLADAAAAQSTSASSTASAQSAPSILFLRPIRGERFSDLPIYIQVGVSAFRLVPPDKQHSNTPPPNTGHIVYSMDDFPVYGTDETQVMIGKFVGERYIPVGWHKVKAELVDVNGNSLNPPVVAETATFSTHAAATETDHVQNGSIEAELNAQELYQMRLQLQELQKELVRIRTGNSGFVPVPASGVEHRE